MIKWLKSLFGFEAPLEPTLQADKDTVEAKAKPAAKSKKTTPKKTTSKKATKAAKQNDALQAMTKNELLEVAKVHGIKANASLSKAELVDRVKNG